MSISRSEARLIAAQERRQRTARGAAVAGTRRSAIAQTALRMASRQVRQAHMAQIAVHNRAIALNNPRLQEHKTFDAIAVVSPDSGNATAPAATPFAPIAGATGGCINQVPLGNNSITRVGRRFANTAVSIRGSVNAGTTTTIAKATMLLIWDRNVNQSAALPAWNTILNSQSPNALTNKDNAPRFKILRRWDYVLSGNNATAGQQNDNSMISIDYFVKLKNKITLLTAADTTGVYPDMVEGGLLLYTTSNQVSGTTAPVFTLSTRLYFSDH